MTAARRVELFEPEDLLLLKPQPSQLPELPKHLLEFGWQMKEHGSAFTLWEEGPEGPRPTFCGGHIRRHSGYAVLWGLFSVHRSKVPAFLTRTVKRYVAQLDHARVDCQVAASNCPACGWARLIGLEEEARLAGAMPGGDDMVIFVRKRAA